MLKSIRQLKLIGIHGKAGAGKDTIANYLCDNYKNTYSEAFADPLKDVAAIAFGIPRYMFDDPLVKNSPNDFWGISPRQILQFVGTELFRYNIHKLNNGHFWLWQEYFWIDRMVGRLKGELDRAVNPEEEYAPGDCVVISDVRFQNEYEWIVDNNGIMIHVTREGADGNVGIPNHASEAGISYETNYDTVFHIENNGTLEDLYRKVDNIMSHYLSN